MTKVKLQNSKPTMWGVVLVVFLVVIVGYIIYKIVNTKSEGFTIDTSKRYILKDTNKNDTITFAKNYTAYYSQNYSFEPPTPVTFTIIPDQPQNYSVNIGLETPIQSLIKQDNGNLITDIRYEDNGNGTGTLKYKYKYSENNIDNNISVNAIEYIEPTTTGPTTTAGTTTTSGATSTTSGATSTTSGATSTTIGATSTTSGGTSTTSGATSTTTGATSTTTGATTTTRSALNDMLDSIQPVIDSSNDMLEFPRYKFIDNQQRLDTLAQRIDTLMNNLQLTKSISIPEKPREVTFY